MNKIYPHTKRELASLMQNFKYSRSGVGVYLDYAATTPMDPLVKKAMMPYFSARFGNPGSLHSFGQEAVAAVDQSREKIAAAINADFREIIFTGSATESNNIALRGIIQKYTRNYAENFRVNLREVREDLRPRLIVSAIEHDSILETARDLERDGIEVIYLPVNKQGIVDLKKLRESLNERTVLVSIMYANNEIGTIQPITEISNLISEFRMQNAELRRHDSKFLIHNSELATALPLLHTDAVQAFQFLDCDVNKLGIDLMTLSAHKIYGPKGIGLLYGKIKNAKLRMQNLSPIITGGGQEFGLRSGTENVPAIVGFAKAVEFVSDSRELENKRAKRLSDYFWQKLKKMCPAAKINGAVNKLPNILNIYFPNQNAQDLLIKLDLNGVAVSSGSACSARATKPSHVLKAISLSNKRIKSSLRFSFGKFTTKNELNRALKIINKALKKV